MINRRKFLTLLGAGFFVTFFSGCGETSKIPVEKISEGVQNFSYGRYNFEQRLQNAALRF